MRAEGDVPDLTTGQRIKLYRERAGKSRPVLAGLVGKSSEWVKAVETGRILAPRLSMLGQIARVLRVDVQDLLDGPEDNVVITAGSGHPALAEVRAVLNRLPLASREPQSLDHIASRLALAWDARHRSPEHRTVIGALLPALISDAQVAARAYRGEDGRRALALLSDVFGLAQMFLAYQPAADLLWRVVDRALLAAQESEDPIALGQAVWFAMEAHRDSGDWDTAMTIGEDAIHSLSSHLDDGGDALAGVYGALQAGCAFTAARAGDDGRAWRYWDAADAVAQRLPATYYQRVTSFSQPVMVAHAVTLEVELKRGGRALRAASGPATAPIPSRPRQARHLIEVARGHYLRKDHAAMLGTLHDAHASAPETIRFNVYARQMATAAMSGPPSMRRQAREIAAKVGLVG
ncbi:helix-turn-helix domain-containing protein [Catenuloplanes sp. NPDC051500]|uniref:helix-turn-helix domain-containing protein n=1 Tax=Catenuloplanes sp. NPDC051500 TaxID=3363959 RepID=UPI00378BCEAD